MKNILLILLAFTFLVSCGEKPANEGDDQTTEVDGTEEQGPTLSFYGADFDPTGAIEVEELATRMDSVAEGEFVIKAKIKETCAKMGCWMSVDRADGNEMMVYMGDHDFFVPTADAAGLDCYINGKAFHDTITVEFQKHLLEDANASQEEIDAVSEERYELAFSAYGVIIEGYEGEETGHEGHDHDHEGHDHDHEGHDHDHEGHDHDHEGHDHESEEV